MAYDLDLEEASARIRSLNASKVLLQLPDGLKTQALEIMARIEELSGASVVLSLTPFYGACDVPCASIADSFDAVVQIGHTPMFEIGIDKKMIHVIARSRLDPIQVLDMAAEAVQGTIGLVTTAQHIHRIDEMAKHLTGKGLKVMIGDGSGRISIPGQVLGCNFSSASDIEDKVDLFIYVGTGNFHPLGIALSTGKRVIIADPEAGRIREIQDVKDKVLRQRHGAITVAKDAKRFGILVCTKPGQYRPDEAQTAIDSIKAAGKEAFLLQFDHLDPSFLVGLGMDCFVSTACPRLAIDDRSRFEGPVITPVELDIVLGKLDWDDYRFDEIA